MHQCRSKATTISNQSCYLESAAATTTVFLASARIGTALSFAARQCEAATAMRRKKTTVSRQDDDVKPIAMTPNVELQLQTINTHSKKIYAKLRPDQQNKKPTHTKPLHDQAWFRDNTFKAHIACYRNKEKQVLCGNQNNNGQKTRTKSRKHTRACAPKHTHTHRSPQTCNDSN